MTAAVPNLLPSALSVPEPDTRSSLKIIYFLSMAFDYGEAIYPGIGPAFAETYGWPTDTIDHIRTAECDVGVVDVVIWTEADQTEIRKLLERPLPFPLFFRVTDPWREDHRGRAPFDHADHPGLHFASTYQPAGLFQDFAGSLKRSGVVQLPFPYDRSRELDVPMTGRQKRVFVSGAKSNHIYPLRSKVRRMRKINPVLRRLSVDLPHPGYNGLERSHNITHDRFVAMASRYTHFLECSSCFRIELMKYLECAYAGCVPIGELPETLSQLDLDNSLVTWRGGTLSLLKAMRADELELIERATAFRHAMAKLRDPVRLRTSFEESAQAVIAGR